jgi:uncharacterized membrane protein
MNNKLKYYLILFLIYSYLGATFEHIMYFFSKKKKSLTNGIITGFALYGLCALSVIWINKKLSLDNIILQIIIYGGLFTILELIIGLYVGAGPNSYTENGNVKFWDYSDNYLNYKGIISIKHYFIWGVMGLSVGYINPYISNFITNGLS